MHEKMRNVCSILVRKPEQSRQLWRRRHKYIENIKMGHKEIGVSNYQLLKKPLPHGDSTFRIIDGNKK
jgi:hypothetical protein